VIGNVKVAKIATGEEAEEYEGPPAEARDRDEALRRAKCGKEPTTLPATKGKR
jgi:hypothetical protein